MPTAVTHPDFIATASRVVCVFHRCWRNNQSQLSIHCDISHRPHLQSSECREGGASAQITCTPLVLGSFSNPTLISLSTTISFQETRPVALARKNF